MRIASANRDRANTQNQRFQSFMDIFKADFLRESRPSFASAYRRAAAVADHQGITVPSRTTTVRLMARHCSQSEEQR